jgi:hypothetical protein
MKRSYATIIILALCASLNYVLPGSQTASLTSAVQAQEVETGATSDQKAAIFPRNRECTTGSLSGKYGVTIHGTILPPLTPAPVPAASVGSFEVDTAGNVTGADTLSLGGQIIPRTYTGAVSVSGNCTFTARITAPGQVINLSGVIVDGGNEIQFIQTDPGTIFTGVAKRL